MAEIETASKKNQAKEEKHRKSRVENASAQPQNLMAWDLTSFLIGETPAEPPIQRHIDLLSANSSPSRQANIALKLQQTYGNRYVQRLIQSLRVQPKLTVGAANDVYEKEAEDVAGQVMAISTPETKNADPGTDKAVLRRKPEEEHESQTFDPASITPLVQRQEEEEEEIQCSFEEAGSIDKTGSFEAGNEIEQTLKSGQGRGAPLPEDVSAFMEPRFGVDFSNVRLHTDSQSAHLNRELSAQAFTYGQDIYLGEGKTNVESDEDKRLLAHELTHVVQQTGAARSATPTNVPRLQLLRNGRVGHVQYEETSEDVIAIRMPYQVESLDEILANIESVIGGAFGSSNRNYTSSPGFPDALRSYLQSIGHPAAAGGGPVMSRQRTLSISIRLIREGRRIQNIELVSQSSRAAAPETPGNAESTSQAHEIPGSAPQEPMSGEWESALSDIEGESAPGGPETTEQSPAPPGSAIPAAAPGTAPRTGSPSTAERIVGGIEAYADALSFRFVMNPVNAQLREWEDELVAIGGQFRSQPLLGQVLLPTITHLFVLLQSIVGTVELLLNVNVIVPRTAALLIALRSELISPEEFNEILLGVGEQGLDILLLGLRQAAAHLRQGVTELNVFRLIQAQDEILLAILALVGMIRGVGALRARLSGRVASGARPAASGAPAEPAPRLPAEPAAPESGTRTRTGAGEAFESTQAVESRPATPGESVRPGVEQTGTSEAHAPTQAAEPGRPAQPGEPSRPAAESAGRGEAFEPTQAQEPVRQPGAAEASQATEAPRPASAGEAPPGSFDGLSVEYTVGEVADARLLRDQIMRGERPGRIQLGSSEVLQAEWEGFGGEGQAPPGWMQNDGALRINRESVGHASPEVQRAYAERLAAEVESRQAAQAVGPRSVQFPINEIENLREMVLDPEQQRMGIDRRANAEAMQRAWEEHGETGRIPDDVVGFINNEGMLIYNEEALATGAETGPRASGGTGNRAATGVGEAFESTQAVESRPAESGRPGGEPTGRGEAFEPTQAREPVRQPGAAEASQATEAPRPASAGEAPPGSFDGLSVEYTVGEVADARLLRDQIMRGERPGRIQLGSPEVLQAEWEGFGGEGQAPPGWMQNDGALRINRESVGHASPEVQRAYAERLAAEVEESALARPGAPRKITDISEVRRLLQDPNQRILRMRRYNMQGAWERALGIETPAPIAYMTSDGVLVVNMDAVRAAEAAPAG